MCVRRCRERSTALRSRVIRPSSRSAAQVEEHSVVGLIETMKLFNSVTAGVGGVVREILVENGELAHHHALLMRIEPEAS